MPIYGKPVGANGVKPNWEQNNENQPDYVKHRTHYRVEEHIDEKQYDLPSADNLLPLVLGEEWYAKGVYQSTPDRYLPRDDKLLLPVVTNSSGDLCICSDGYTDFTTGSEKYNCFVVYADHIYQDAAWKNNDRAAVKVLYRAAYSKIQYKTLDEDYIPTTVPRTLSASAGDILRVKSVDENGKPTEWEAVENPTETLTVNLTMADDESITADKTFAEIKEAYDNGKIVMAKFMETGCVPLTIINDSTAKFQVMTDNQVMWFKCVSNGGSDRWVFDLMDMTTVADARSLGISSASVGQIVKIKSVDSSGKPTAWEAVDFPEQVQSDWEQTDESAIDYVKNRSFGNFAHHTIDFSVSQGNGELKKAPTFDELHGVAGEKTARIEALGNIYCQGKVVITLDSAYGNTTITFTSDDELTELVISGKYGNISKLVINKSNISWRSWYTYSLCIDGLSYIRYQKLSGDSVERTLPKAGQKNYIPITNINGDWYAESIEDAVPILGISGASAGQIPVIKTVDTNGVPTEYSIITKDELAEAAASIVDTSLLSIIGEVS